MLGSVLVRRSTERGNGRCATGRWWRHQWKRCGWGSRGLEAALHQTATLNSHNPYDTLRDAC